jgi:hypothetical protein
LTKNDWCNSNLKTDEELSTQVLWTIWRSEMVLDFKRRILRDLAKYVQAENFSTKRQTKNYGTNISNAY